MSPNRNWSASPAGRLKADPISPWYYNDGLLNKMADGPCPATNQQAWKDRSGAAAGPISSQESPRHGSRRFNIRHSALPSGMETSWPFLLSFPVTSGLREMTGGPG